MENYPLIFYLDTWDHFFFTFVTHKTINFSFGTHKTMNFSFGTHKTMNFSFLSNRKLMVLGEPIFKHIMVSVFRYMENPYLI